MGFSKSAARTLLLRHPQTFGRAAAWDAPLMMEEIGKYGTGDILGTQENFKAYRPAELLKQNADTLRSKQRFILTGYGNFRQHHQQTHDLLDKLEIAHEYRAGITHRRFALHTASPRVHLKRGDRRKSSCKKGVARAS